MEIILNLGLCNAKLACGLNLDRESLQPWKSRSRTLATLRYRYQWGKTSMIVADFGIWIVDSFVFYTFGTIFSEYIETWLIMI